MNFDLERLVRRNIRDLKPYSSARSEFSGSARVFLDANENSFGSPAGVEMNRYPDPLQGELKRRIAELNEVTPERIFVGNGSDEAIDLLFRTFCEPGRDDVIVCPPTYGMYEVSASINEIEVIKVPLIAEFQLDTNKILAAVSAKTKLIFICSPNNPTGNLMDRGSILEIARSFAGLVAVDEAYIHFAREGSVLRELDQYPNIVVLQTFSKAWGMAGLRVGTAFAGTAIIDLLNRVKPPYNVNTASQRTVLDALNEPRWMEDHVKEALKGRAVLEAELKSLPDVEKIMPSDANFVLVRIRNADAVYRELVLRGIVVRNRSSVELCDGCLRITVGTPDENEALVSALRNIAAGISEPAGTFV